MCNLLQIEQFQCFINNWKREKKSKNILKRLKKPTKNVQDFTWWIMHQIGRIEPQHPPCTVAVLMEKWTIKWVHRHSFFGAKAVEMKVFYDTLISRSLRRISSSICWSVFRGGIECVLISVMCGMMLRGTLVMFQLSSGVRYSIIWLRVSCVVPNRNGNPLTFANRSSNKSDISNL